MTEQICLIVGANDCDDSNVNGKDKDNGSNHRQLLEVYSHVQTRGSIPLHWSSPANVKAYRPRVYIGVDPIIQARGLRDHALGEFVCYSSMSTPLSGGVIVAMPRTTTQQTRSFQW